MVQIVDKNNTGKTEKLMRAARRDEAWFVCNNPERALEKAHSYGITGLRVMSYDDYTDCLLGKKYSTGSEKFYIDELSSFFYELDRNCKGFSLTIN